MQGHILAFVSRLKAFICLIRCSIFSRCHRFHLRDAGHSPQDREVERYRGTSLIRTLPPVGLYTIALCLESYGDPRGVGVSYERGTPVWRTPLLRPITRVQGSTDGHGMKVNEMTCTAGMLTCVAI